MSEPGGAGTGPGPKITGPSGADLNGTGPADRATAIPVGHQSALIWLVPAVALCFAAWIAVSAWRDRGVMVTVTFADGHGLVAGDAVKHRGIAVGSVRSAVLGDDAESVVVTLALRPDAAGLARGGSRFWLVRPEIGLQRISGIETIIGARSVAVIPGDGPPQRTFVGLEEAPVVGRRTPDDLAIVIESPRRGSFSPGSPVTYRQVQVGVIETVSLAGDAASVEVFVHIDPAYAPLVRERTVFWDAGGIEVGVGLRGVTAAVESPESFFRGGLALATPPEAGAPARRGARFRLAERVEESWLQWRPSIALGSGFLPPGLAEPRPVGFTLAWRGGLLGGARRRSGLVLETARGVIGPAWMVAVPEDAKEGSVSITLEGTGASGAVAWAAPLPEIAASRGVVLLAIEATGAPWPVDRMRAASDPEDVVIIGARGVAALPISPGRLRADGGSRDGGLWIVDPAVIVDPRLDGAAVVARVDGCVVGILRVEDGAARVAPLPTAALPSRS